MNLTAQTPARLQIWINRKPVLQGKLYELDGKLTFLFNVDKNKWFRNYGGWSVADQIFSEFPRLQIIAKNTDTHINYVATKSKFFKKGIKGFWQGHTQWVLPANNWEVFKGKLNEPFGLPAMTVDEWKKPKEVNHLNIDVSMDNYLENMSRLGKIFRSKFAI